MSTFHENSTALNPEDRRMTQPSNVTERLEELRKSKVLYEDVMRRPDVSSNPDDAAYFKNLPPQVEDRIKLYDARRTVESRIFGQAKHIRDMKIRYPGWLSDWALIELDQEKLDGPLAELRNGTFAGALGGTGEFIYHHMGNAIEFSSLMSTG
ncbi:hypothetical protein ColLi_02963 [Colletotrichum liriopes]|uniref:Uncharacterized protein n=1 Tax=Colletotrichum liriopes TaxID=708192 RepID=A0AA37LPB0_9PEZI|nr:hypothetical protein ColLi_02963 [Colletotrichum liriopes]